MTELKVIEQQEVLGKDFKVYGDFENPMFLAKDISTWIEYSESNTSKLLGQVDENEKSLVTIVREDGSTHKQWFLTEDGLYEVLMQSRKPIAKEFKKQVKTILKEIRQKGSYARPMTQTEILAQSVQLLVEMEKRVDEVQLVADETKTKLNTAIDIFASPVPAEDWKAETNRKLNALCKSMGKPYQSFRGDLYAELETIARCDITARQRNLKARLKKGGATYNERKAISKIDVIARDEKLKLVFDGIVRRYQAKYLAS